MNEEFNVAVTLKIYLDDFNHADDVKKKLSKLCKVVKTWDEEIGFGIKILKASVLLQDKEGGTDAFEESLLEFPEISQVQIEDVSRV